MNLMRIGVLLGILVTVGCASHFPQSSLTGKVFEVKIGESLSPQVVTVQQGDEVRWINTRSGPVDISFESLEGVVSCQKGFVSTGWGYLFGAPGPEFLVIATEVRETSQGRPSRSAVNQPFVSRHGLVTRTVYPTKPPSVEYALTDLGRTLFEPVMGLVTWAQKSQATIEQARVKYDKAQSG